MKQTNFIYTLLITLFFGGCIKVGSSDIYETLIAHQLSKETVGKAKFLYGDMGGISLHNLKSNAFVYKIAIIAFRSLPKYAKSTEKAILQQYGFAYSTAVWNWQNLPIAIDSTKPMGLAFGTIKGNIPLKGKFVIETADLSCAACHAGPLYDIEGKPTSSYVLGMPNTQLNLNAFANDLFEGYKNIISLSEKDFMASITATFPNTNETEKRGLLLIFKQLKKEIPKIANTRGHVTAYNVGGVGTMNGIGGIKANLGLLPINEFHDEEGALVSIPTLAGRAFRSSLLVSGNYAPINQPFFVEKSIRDTSFEQTNRLSPIVAVFTIGTMGHSAKSAAKAIPDIQDVMAFINNLDTPAFPSAIDAQMVEKGSALFATHCEKCHGKYEGNSIKKQLISYPNKFVATKYIGTDPVRANAITTKDFEVLNRLPQKGTFQTAVNDGYVAPILSGLWATAPYLHNGAVPTIWHLMHPEQRPAQFYVGGHTLDYTLIGIRGTVQNGIYDFTSPSNTSKELFDTTMRGASNKGHEKPFDKLTEQEKAQLLEFLKTL